MARRPTGRTVAGTLLPCRFHPAGASERDTADYNDMIYAATPEEIAIRREAFIRKWKLKHLAVADSLEEAGERLFTFTRLPPSQWRVYAPPMQSSVCTKSSSEDQDANRAAIRRRHRRDVFLGAAGIRADQHGRNRCLVAINNNYNLGLFTSLFATEGIARSGRYLHPLRDSYADLFFALGNRLSAGLPPVLSWPPVPSFPKFC
jgi:hypothetical protein